MSASQSGVPDWRTPDGHLTATPAADVEVTLADAQTMLRAQFPELAGRQLRPAGSGWDNIMVRLGEDLAMRLPRRSIAAKHGATELDWLPRMGAAWTFNAPIPVHIGQPHGHYPWRWSIVPWIDGERALAAPLNAHGARDLGSALAQIHVLAPADAPLNPVRSLPLSQRRGRLLDRLGALERHPHHVVDAARALADVDVAAAMPQGEPRWCHLDVHGNNILTANARLAGIIDWGDAGRADPHTDLGQALYLLGTSLFEDCAHAYVAATGPADPWSITVRAEAIVYAVTMACIDDAAYASSGWTSLMDLGLAT